MARRRGEADESRERFWRGVVARQAGSGLSIREWCRREAIQEPAFYWWRRRLAAQALHGASKGRTAAVAVGKATDFLPVRLASSAAIEIVLTDGVRLQVTPGVTADQLRQVLCALRTAAC